jgi:nitrogen fixation NifU-like protein
VTRDERNDLLLTGVNEPAAAVAAHVNQAVEALARSSRREAGERLVLSRQRQIAVLTEHFNNPHHRGVLEGADVAMPGGSPECGGAIVIYLKAGEEGRIKALSFTGQGDIISQAATNLILEQVLSGGLTMEEVLALDYDAFVDSVGREAVGSRTRNATLGLSTLKSAIKKYQLQYRFRGERELV